MLRTGARGVRERGVEMRGPQGIRAGGTGRGYWRSRRAPDWARRHGADVGDGAARSQRAGGQTRRAAGRAGAEGSGSRWGSRGGDRARPRSANFLPLRAPRPMCKSSGLPRVAAVAAHSRFSRPAGTRRAGKLECTAESSGKLCEGQQGRKLSFI